MQKSILILLLVSSVLIAQDCSEYKEEYDRYVKKANTNNKMASRYLSVAKKYNYMYMNCIKQDRVIVEQIKSVAKQYRVNPYNTK